MSRRPTLPTILASGLLLALAVLALASPASSYHEGSQPAPTVTINHPGEGDVVTGLVEVRGEASAEESVHSVEVRVDAGDWVEASGRENWTYEWNTTGLEDGDHLVSARSFDGTKYSEVDQRNVTVSNGPGDDGNTTDDGNATEENTTEPVKPTVEIRDPPPEAEVNGTVLIHGTASSAAGTIDRVMIQVDDGPWTRAEGTATWSFEWNTTGLDGGDHEVTVRAFDTNDNSNETTRTYEVEGGGFADVADTPEPTSTTGVALLVVAAMASIGLVLWAWR